MSGRDRCFALAGRACLPGGTRHSVVKTRRLYQCSACRTQSNRPVSTRRQRQPRLLRRRQGCWMRPHDRENRIRAESRKDAGLQLGQHRSRQHQGLDPGLRPWERSRMVSCAPHHGAQHENRAAWQIAASARRTKTCAVTLTKGHKKKSPGCVLVILDRPLSVLSCHHLSSRSGDQKPPNGDDRCTP